MGSLVGGAWGFGRGIESSGAEARGWVVMGTSGCGVGSCDSVGWSCDAVMKSADCWEVWLLRGMSRLKQSGMTTTNSSSEPASLERLSVSMSERKRE